MSHRFSTALTIEGLAGHRDSFVADGISGILVESAVGADDCATAKVMLTMISSAGPISLAKVGDS